MSDQSLFVALTCKVCGGKLDIPKQNAVEQIKGVYTIVGNSVFTCQYCDTEYLPKQSLERFGASGNVIISGNTGDLSISGNIVTGPVSGDVINTDKVMVSRVSGDKFIEGIAAGSDPALAELHSVLIRWYREIETKINALSTLDDDEKEILKKNVRRVAKEVAKGPQAEVGKIERCLNIIGANAPEILDVTTRTLQNPLQDVGLVLQKIGSRVKLERQM